MVLLLCGAPLQAQGGVERPIPFDAAGQVLVLTPQAAARAQLVPPAWRVTGDFEGARLYDLGGGAYILVVTRRNGPSERYPLTAADVADLRARLANVRPSSMFDRVMPADTGRTPVHAFAPGAVATSC